MQKPTTVLNLAGVPVFTPLYRQHADAVGFPDTSAVLERLGLAVTDGKIRIRADAELHSIRDAMLERDAATAAWREALAADQAPVQPHIQ